MTGMGENRYLLKTSFPWNLIFDEMMYVDDGNKTSVDLMHKYGIGYFKPLRIYTHPEFPEARLVIARFKKKESEKWKRVLDDLLILCRGKDYRGACENLYWIVKEHFN